MIQFRKTRKKKDGITETQKIENNFGGNRNGNTK
jgi:hypothetical protein